MKKRCTVLLLAIFLYFPAAYSDTLTIAYDHWDPYVGSEADDQQGYVVDLLRKIYWKHGLKIELKTTPYSRALAMLYAGQVDLVPGVYEKDVDDERVIFAKEELGMSVNMFFTSINSTWKYTGQNSLKSQILGLVSDYSFPEIQSYVKKNKGKDNIVFSNGEKALEISLKNLVHKRTTAILDDHLAVEYLSQKLNYEGKIRKAGVAGRANRLLAAFPKISSKSKRYAELLTEGLNKLRKTGELERILNAYGLKDWK